MISNLINVADIPSSARLKYQAILNSSFSTSFSDFSAFSKTTAREKKSFWGSEITSSKSPNATYFPDNNSSSSGLLHSMVCFIIKSACNAVLFPLLLAPSKTDKSEK